MVITTRRKVRRYCFHLLLLALFLIVFVDFDVEQNIRQTPDDSGPRQRRIREKWNEKDEAIPTYYERSRAAWSNLYEVPLTIVQRHVPGWTFYDNLYIYKGTMYVVTNATAHIPDVRMMISAGRPLLDEHGDELRREPTEQHMKVLTPDAAYKEFGSFAKRVEGTSFIVNEAPQYFQTTFSFIAEIFFGLWRTYSTMDVDITSQGETGLEAPHRIILPNIIDFLWREKDQHITWFLNSIFPNLHVQTAEDWQDFVDLELPHIYDRVVLADRGAAYRFEDYRDEQHFAAATLRLAGSANWWIPIRNLVHDLGGLNVTAQDITDHVPVITYLSWQGHGPKSLLDESHNALIRELSRLQGTYGFEFRTHPFDELTFVEAATAAARSTILIGLRQDVLLSLLWMIPTKKSSVIELHGSSQLSPNYAWNAIALGMEAYTFFGSKESYRYPNRPKRINLSTDGPVTVDAAAVAALCVEILSR